MQKERVESKEQAREVFEKVLGEKLTLLIASPGRVNLIGEHTDYNMGFSVPSAIDRYVFIGFVDKSSSGATGQDQTFQAEIISLDFDERFTITKVEKYENKTWMNYIAGVIDKIGQHMGGVKGKYRAVIAGNLGIGMGISSSAALSCGFAFGLNELLGAKLTKDEIALAAQWTEHNYAGTKCGLLDQTAIIFSRDSSFIKVDFLKNEKAFYTVPFPFTIMLLHSGQFHSLSESCYNQRVSECKEAARLILLNAGKPVAEPVFLRECSLEDLQKAEATLDPVLYKRASYVIQENMRVEHILERITERNYDEIRKNMRATHEGLSQLYEVSTERLDFLADESHKLTDLAFGARLMGGGFGGCTINLVFDGKETEFLGKMSQAFAAKYNEDLISISVKLSPGVQAYRF